MMPLKQKIKIACAMADISQADLANRLGISPPNFSKRLNVGKFTQEELERIADAIGCEYVSEFRFYDGRKI